MVSFKPVPSLIPEGIYNINKPVDWTSHDVVAKIRNLSKIKKVGHAGTLDPLATGVLVVALGRQYTKHLQKISATQKEYLATVQLGYTTETFDAEKPRQNENPVSVTQDQIVEALQSFLGEQEQLPPMYSAVQVNGKRLYQHARQGVVIERSPRLIHIHSLEIKEITPGSFAKVTFLMTCSSGTYVRSLAHDLGQKLGCGGYLAKLIRTRVGEYRLEESIDFLSWIAQSR